MKKLTAGFLNEVMQLEAENQIQARPMNGLAETSTPHGTRSRKLKTIYGERELDKPQIREFPFETAVFERFSRVEDSLRVAVENLILRSINQKSRESILEVWIKEHICI